MSVVARNGKKSTVYWIAFPWQGKRVWERSGTDRRAADRLDKQRKGEVKAGTYVPPTDRVATTVGQYLRDWLDKRTNRTADDDRRWIQDYVLALDWFTDLPLVDVRPRHIGQLVDALKAANGKKTGKPLANKSISNIYGAVRTVFRDARIAELTTADACVLPPGTISRKVKKKRAPYAASDVRAMVSESAAIDESIFSALAFFTGCREGEICGRRFRDWDRNPSPLGSLLVATQYNEQPLKTDDASADHPRSVPVHPELAGILEWWWSTGFEFVHARKPTAEDFIVPNRTLTAHTKSSAYKLWRRACVAAGVENRSLHSTRHTFISLARRGGAPKDIVEKITHNATGDIVDAYTTWDWKPLCEAVLCIDIGPQSATDSPPTVDKSVDREGMAAKNKWRRRESKPGYRSGIPGILGNGGLGGLPDEGPNSPAFYHDDADRDASQRLTQCGTALARESLIWESFDAFELAARGEA